MEGDMVVFDKPPSTKETARETREREEHEFARNQVVTNKRTTWFNGLLVLATFSTVAIGVWQGFISQIAADAAYDSVGLADRSAAETRRNNAQQAILAEKSREDAKDASDANAKAAVIALNATIESSHLEQRAWLAPSLWETKRNENGLIYFNIAYKNTGKTPAVVVVAILTATSNLGDIPKFDTKPLQRGDLVAPDTSVHITTEHRLLTEKELAANIAGDPLYLYGTIWYNDIFGRQHWTQFCTSTMRKLVDFSPCPTHNRSDDNSLSK